MIVAHAGHVLVDMLYALPLLILLGLLLVGRVRERRAREKDARAGAPGDPGGNRPAA